MTRLTTIAQQGQWFKGNLHTHSNRSDGDLTPAVLVERYRALDYQFLAITDHRIYSDFSEFNDDSFLLLPGVELDVAVTGAEAYCHHVVGIGRPGLNTFAHDQVITYPVDISLNGLLKILKDNGNLCIYAHPGWSQVYPEVLADNPGFMAMEIYNHVSEVSCLAGSAEAWYNRLLWDRHKVYCVAADDAHHDNREIGGGFIGVKAPSLSAEDILAALEAGSFYASEGPAIEEFYVAENRVYVRCSPVQQIVVMNDQRPRSGVSADDSQLTEIELQLAGNESYVRAVVKDRDGKKAWTQPIWLE